MDQYTFIWRGTDPQGKSRSEKIKAANAQTAREELTRAGWTNLELIQDEISAATAGYVEKDPCCDEPEFTVDEEVEFFEGKQPGMFRQWISSLWSSKIMIVIFGAMLGLGIYYHRLWAIITGAIILGIVLMFFPTIYLLVGAASRNYSRLNRAKVWGRWDEVLECVERLRKRSFFSGGGIGEVELVRCRAQALAAKGQLEKGLAEFKKFEKAPNVEHWMYLSHVGTIYDMAKKYEEAHECRKKSAEEMPDNSGVWVDVAYGAVRGLNRPAEAREALARAEALEITGIGKAYLPFLRGVICWREKKFEEAKKQLNEALKSFTPLAHHDLVQGLILLTRSYLCVVHTEMGDKATAKKLFGKVEKFLVANREDELLAICRGV
jgi:hypothetical protein